MSRVISTKHYEFEVNGATYSSKDFKMADIVFLSITDKSGRWEMACNNNVLVYVPIDADDEIFTLNCEDIEELSEFFRVLDDMEDGLHKLDFEIDFAWNW